MSERIKQPPVPGNTISSAPPRQMSWPGTIDAVQNSPLSALHSCRGRTTTAVSSVPLSPLGTHVGCPKGRIRHTAKPTNNSSQLLICAGTPLSSCCAILVTLSGICYLVSHEGLQILLYRHLCTSNQAFRQLHMMGLFRSSSKTSITIFMRCDITWLAALTGASSISSNTWCTISGCKWPPILSSKCVVISRSEACSAIECLPKYSGLKQGF